MDTTSMFIAMANRTICIALVTYHLRVLQFVAALITASSTSKARSPEAQEEPLLLRALREA